MTEIFSATEHHRAGWPADGDNDGEAWLRQLTEYADALAAGPGFDEGHAGGCG